MGWLLFSAGALGMISCTAFKARLDPFAALSWRRFLLWLKRTLQRPDAPVGDLVVLQQLQAGLRAGQSLDAALSSLLSTNYLPLGEKRRISAILQGRPAKDFLSRFLASALESGVPLLAALASLQKSLLAEKRLRLRAQAMTSQARAQGEVLSYLPWVMAAGIFMMDQEWFYSAARSPLAWCLWGLAFLLTGLGRFWMSHLLTRALRPRGATARLEEEVLPKLVLGVAAELSLGRDPETALDRAWEQLENPRERAAFQAASREQNSLAHFHFLFSSAATSGAPLRDDLLRFLEELHLSGEARWEERVQRLPVVMMLPLFLCFFPGSLAVLLALVLPLLRSF